MSSPGYTPRWIALDGAVNARVVVPAVLLRTDNLQSLSADDVHTLIDQHALEVVIDLRTDVEAKVEGAGPMNAERDVRIELRSLYPDSVETAELDGAAVKPWEARNEHESPDEQPVVRAYMGYLRQRPDSIVGAVRAIACARGAVLVHCAAGKDRTGVVVALALDAAGVDRATIVADYLATAERIDAIVARLLQLSPVSRPARGQRLPPPRARPRHDRACARARRRTSRRIRRLAPGERARRVRAAATAPSAAQQRRRERPGGRSRLSSLLSSRATA